MIDPTFLPEVVTEQIFIRVPVKDLLSCCLVSSSWRDAVNKNIIWKKHCSPKINLEDVKSEVKPSFEVANSDCDNLTPICEYRQKYMKEIHLRNNFRSSRCVEYQISLYSCVYVDGIVVIDKNILLNDDDHHMIYVWDIEGKPFLIQSVPHLLNERYLKTFKSFGDYLLIIQCTLLQIYEIVEGKFSLKMCRVLDMEQAFSLTIPAADSLSEWYCGLNRNDFSEVVIVGKYMTGIECENENQSVMHIWDLETGKKLKKDTIPLHSFMVRNIFCGTNSEYMYISLITKTSNGPKYKLLIYSLEKLQFTCLGFESMCLPFVGYERFVILFSCVESHNIVFLDSNTAEKIAEISVKYLNTPPVYDVYNSMMAIVCNNKTVMLVDLATHEVLLILDVGFVADRVYFLDFNILVLSKHRGLLEVWDIRNKCHLYTLNKRKILWSDRGLTRLCVLNDQFQQTQRRSCSINKYW